MHLRRDPNFHVYYVHDTHFSSVVGVAVVVVVIGVVMIITLPDADYTGWIVNLVTLRFNILF